MLKFLVTYGLFLLILLSLNGCKRYPDGPDFSLLTVKQRLKGTYRLDAYLVNGFDSINYTKPCANADFNKPSGAKVDGKYYYQFLFGHKQMDIRGMDGNGTFSLHNHKKEFWIGYGFYSNVPNIGYRNFWVPNNCNDEGIWDILRLTRKEFWIKNEICGNEVILHLTKIN